MLGYNVFEMVKGSYDYQSLHSKIMISLVFLIVITNCFQDAITYISNQKGRNNMSKFMIKLGEKYIGSGAGEGYALYDNAFPECPEVFYTESESFAQTHLAYMIRNNPKL